jgi:O-antigen/teichoic acid export membrane protein
MSNQVEEQEQEQTKEAKELGKGLLVITAAKLWFMVGGALITFGLPYIFNTYGEDGTALYGKYYDINNTLSIFSMVLVTGGLQAVSKWTSQFIDQPAQAQGALRQLFYLMLVLSVVVGGGFMLAAPWIAQWRGNADLTNSYRVAGIVLSSYALYVVFIGALNGRKQFVAQAMFDMGFTTLKFILVLGLAFLGYGVMGAFSGFALAAFLICVIAVWKVGLGEKGIPSPPKEVYGYALQVMAYTLVFNLIFKLDLLLVKPVAQTLFATEADRLMGIYGMAINVSRLPWQATIAVTFVIFPLLSQATFSKDMEKSKSYIRQTLRYLTLLTGLACAVLMALPQAVTAFLPSAYNDVASVLIWSAPAYFCFSLFNMVNTLLMSAGRATSAFMIGLITVVIAALLYHFYLPYATTQLELIVSAAQASLCAFTLGLALGLIRLGQLFGSPLPLMSVIRVAISGGVLILVGPYWNQLFTTPTKISMLLGLGVLALIYLGLLTILKEWNTDDVKRFNRLSGRGSKA